MIIMLMGTTHNMLLQEKWLNRILHMSDRNEKLHNHYCTIWTVCRLTQYIISNIYSINVIVTNNARKTIFHSVDFVSIIPYSSKKLYVWN